MTMRIKVDEDLPSEVVELLQASGHDAVSVIDQNMRGWKDDALWAAVQREMRLLITADKGFGDLRSHQPGTHAGVLLLRPDQDGIRPLIELLESVLRGYDLDALAGTVAVVTPRGIRMRR
jgi:predicted nuclease of predicted toxin-antitoxin system